ncbi:large ribosomal subunit protein mL38 [Monosporozyma servazzii]
MLRRSLHSTALKQQIWKDFTKRSESLSVRSPILKQSLLNNESQGSTESKGPYSLRRRNSKIRYKKPEQIDETFQVAYSFLQDRAETVYKKLNQVEDPKEQNKLLVKAEINNPEVQYNFQFSDKIDNNPRLINYDLPVYRALGRKHWESKDQMLLMQRLETLHAIPDTLPTLLPRANVMIKFPYSTGVNKWVEPGQFLSSNVTQLEPIFKIQEYETVDVQKQRYTVLVVNPDEPDLATDSFKTTLCYGLQNLKLDYNDNVIDARKFNPEENKLIDYLPPVPEKNAGKQRFVVWVFRQPASTLTDISTISRDSFDIRQFVELNELDPIGAHIWRSEWDTNVNNVREKYGLPKGRVFSKVRTP